MVTEPSSVESEEQLKVQSQLEEEGPSSSKYSTKGKEKSEVSNRSLLLISSMKVKQDHNMIVL